MKKILYALFTLLLVVSCKEKQQQIHVEKSFYHWKSEYIESESLSKMQELNIKKLYVKLFEVDYSISQGNFPINKLNFYDYQIAENDSIKLIPTLFIRNQIFQHNNLASLDKLADDIVFLVNKKMKLTYSEELLQYEEIQIDCDWTKSTKEKYFYLLKKIKELSNKKISCTLRLYPYKYSEIMGVPPVDKVTLMCYNLIQPLSQQKKNSILDVEELSKYLTRKTTYPLHLDVALPLFYWSQLYQNNQFIKLLNYNSADLKGVLKEIKPMWYEVIKDTNLNYQTYLREGDRIKCEEVSRETLKKTIKLLTSRIKFDDKITVSLFDLDASTFNKYSDEEITSFYSDFSK